MTLPSPEEIARRAEEAAAKAQGRAELRIRCIRHGAAPCLSHCSTAPIFGAAKVCLELRRQGDALGRDASNAGSSAANISRRFFTSRSSTPATCAARAAGWMSSAARGDRSRDAEPHHHRRQSARERVLRHPRRRAVHAPQLLDLLAAHPDCYFQVFTNGQFITEKSPSACRDIGNATPLISIEGREIISDERRGKKDVFDPHPARPRALPQGAAPDRRRHERLPDRTSTNSHRSMARRTDRPRRALRLVSHLSPGRPKMNGNSPSRPSNSCRCADSSSDARPRCPSPSSTPITTARARRSAR